MNKTQIIIGGVRAAEFSINLKSGAGILNDIMIISVNPIENYQPDHMRRRVVTKKDYKFKYNISDEITWRGFRIIHGRLDKIYLIEDEILNERDVLKRINL